jgi:hypothetical protein
LLVTPHATGAPHLGGFTVRRPHAALTLLRRDGQPL